MGQTSKESEVKVKLVVVGDCACGKTTLIKRYINSSYTDVSFTFLHYFSNSSIRPQWSETCLLDWPLQSIVLMVEEGTMS